jgi:purine operon repressor
MKRSDRLIVITQYFIEHPHTNIKLAHFGKLCNTTKSSISEDLDIIEHAFEEQGFGYLVRTTGASGGVRYIPKQSREENQAFIHDLCGVLSDPTRRLPGGYLYMSDLLGDPGIVRSIGRVLASAFADLEIDAIVTVATKGIPLAYAVASFLHVPVVIARRDPQVTEGTSVSINYVSGSSKRIQTMVLSKRSLKSGAKVCIIDDFMKAGGTIMGITNLLQEFDAEVKAIGVLAETDGEEENRKITNYTSLIKITPANDENEQIKISPGNLAY